MAWICIEMSGAVTTVNSSWIGATAVGAKAVGATAVGATAVGACADTGKDIATVGNDSTMVTLLEFLELELDAPQNHSKDEESHNR